MPDEDTFVKEHRTNKDEFPELEVDESARAGDVTPPLTPVDGPPYVYPPGDANQPHENTEWGESQEIGRRAKAGDARDLGAKFGQREARRAELSTSESEESTETLTGLKARASELSISGRSSMSKDELRAAISEAERDEEG